MVVLFIKIGNIRGRRVEGRVVILFGIMECEEFEKILSGRVW